MEKKLSEIKYKLEECDFNGYLFPKVLAALIEENNLEVNSLEDYFRLFPDQANSPESVLELFNNFKELNNTNLFLEKLINWDKSKKICIIGDYDSDGITASLIMLYTLNKLDYNVSFTIPDRLDNDYGMSVELIKKEIEENNPDLFITVDNGISGKETCQYIISLGKEIIVTDHHIPGEDIPENVLIIDPKYNDDDFQDICGAFVALKLCYSLLCNSDISDNTLSTYLEDITPLAGIGTITDMMPMIDENRLLVKYTLEEINKAKYIYSSHLNKFLNAFNGQYFLRSKSDSASESLISYYIGPNINAISRVDGDCRFAVQDILDMYLDKIENPQNYRFYNIRRQDLSKKLFDDYSRDEHQYSSVFVYNKENYDFRIKGILGLIANKISSTYNIVALVGYAKNEDIVEFSGRSQQYYNLYEGIDRINTAHPELGLSWGGHAQAMGVRIKNSEEAISQFKDLLDEDIKNNTTNIDPTVFVWEPEYESDCMEWLNALQPYGNHFQTLTFTYTGNFADYNEDKHLFHIGDYYFKSFIPQNLWNTLLGKSVKVNFNINFENFYGAEFFINSIRGAEDESN